eukprot:gene1413-4102_t
MSYDDDFTWPGRGNGHDICKIHGSSCAFGKCNCGLNNTNVCYADCGDCGTEKQTIKFWEVVVAGSVFLLCVCGFGGFRFHARRSRIQSYNVQVNVGTGHI